MWCTGFTGDFSWLGPALVDADGQPAERAGVTPRGLVDCMIAAVASATATPVLAHDRDFTRIADVVDLALDEHSLRP